MILSFIPPVVGHVAKFLIADWHAEINMITMIALIPFAWKMIVAVAASFNTSIGFRDGYCTLRYCRFYRFHKILHFLKKINNIIILLERENYAFFRSVTRSSTPSV